MTTSETQNCYPRPDICDMFGQLDRLFWMGIQNLILWVVYFLAYPHPSTGKPQDFLEGAGEAVQLGWDGSCRHEQKWPLDSPAFCSIVETIGPSELMGFQGKRPSQHEGPVSILSTPQNCCFKQDLSEGCGDSHHQGDSSEVVGADSRTLGRWLQATFIHLNRY